MDFVRIKVNKLQFDVYQPWWDKGIKHGFTGKLFDFSAENIGDSSLQLCAALDIRKICVLEQIHSDKIINVTGFAHSNVSDSDRYQYYGKADGFILENKKDNTAYGIKTADCLPVIIKSDEKFAILHAGWRGVAGNLFANAVESIKSEKPLEIVIGPAAGKNDYEVGSEVIEALGDFAVYTSAASGRYLLDLPQTAINKIKSLAKISNIAIHPSSTIADSYFHSYRRDKKLYGRNLLWWVG